MEIIPLELKKTDALTLNSQLKEFLEKHYGQEVAREYDNAIVIIQQHRTELRNLQEKSEGARDMLLKYACEVAFVERRFPINGGADRINMVFPWYDAFTKRKVSQGNIFYEQANVLYNAAVLECQLGCSESRNTDESIKNAVKNFQNAAGIFQYVKEKVCSKIVEKISNDLTNESLDCLVLMMLANTQQCIVEKAEKGKMKPGIISKLCASTSDMFSQVHKLMNTAALQDQFDKSWKGYARYKELYFQSLANYYVSRELHEADEIGKELSRLTKAKSIMDEAKNCKLSSSLYSHCKTYMEVLDKAYKAADFDNQKVYHERVPDVSTLEVIERKDLAKIPQIDLFSMVTVSDPFEKLFPIRVMEFRLKYFEQLNTLVQNMFKEAREHRKHIKSQLAAVGLPGSIFAAEQKQGLPEQVHNSIAKVNAEGGMSRIAELKNNVEDMALETGKALEAVRKLLDEEQEDDTSCRNQFGARWSRHPSATLTINIRKSLDEYNTKLSQAQKSDQLINGKLAKHAEHFNRFQMDKQDLDRLMPNPDLNDNNDTIGKSYQDLKLFLQQIDQLFAQEESLENDTRVAQQEDKDQIDKRLLQQQDNLETAVTQELSKYDTFSKELNRLSNEEDALLEQILQANQLFDQSRSHSASLQQREAVVQDVMLGISKYDEVIANLQEGARFYSTMQTIIKKLNQNVSDFVFARKTEKQDLISTIQSSASGVNASFMPPQQSTPSQQPKAAPQQPKIAPQQQQYYHPSQSQYAPQYNAPPQQYTATAPPPQYNAPPQQYNAPPPQYSAPPQQYNAPQQQYNAPPQQGYGYPPQLGYPPNPYTRQPPQQFTPQQFPPPPKKK